MSTPVYCPHCGSTLSTKSEGGRDRAACVTDGCGYMHFGDMSIGCGGVVVSGERALLVQRSINPGKGMWQIPGGYVEVDEPIYAAVEREVLEEAGVVARVTDSLGFRHQVQSDPKRAANLYVVFRLEPISGEPMHDGIETMNAGYFSLEEMASMDGVQSLSKWAVRLALAHPPAAGFVSDSEAFPLRPGQSLFGLNGLHPKV